MSLELHAKYVNNVLKYYSQQFDHVVEDDQPITEIMPNGGDSFVTVDQLYEDGLAYLNSNEFYALSLVGPQGTGKTNMIIQFAIRALRDGFKIIYALPEDYLNDVDGWLHRTLEDPKPKVFLVLEDLSYSLGAQSKKNTDLMKNFVSRFRHLYKAQVFVIYITHRLHAAPPMLRNSASWIFTNMQSGDRDDALEIVGKNKEIKQRLESVYQFISRVTLEGVKFGIVHYRLEDQDYTFRWGKKDDPGDGRLMCVYHGADLKIFKVEKAPELINLDEYRYPKDGLML